mmetsp:Transcript_11598/g.14128  ORF Transcript_11598/g.14128 Transcript_11598/m.14128 type:complete len:93 (+) Transcript_11598:72-350(+)
MSYYNLPPTKFANEHNEFERSLRALPADGAVKGLDLLETITRNTAQNPKEEKYRKVRTTNEKLSPFFVMLSAADRSRRSSSSCLSVVALFGS